ncbi:DNA replication initiation control protein YabA [Isobaculum melis]|uniref:DNA replication initiation control protein YabA n=1 Tax=Isobaculum melis TaxID=142588 RepID=UPI000B899CE8|nr:DNA replication initiation control protein YabA [Isobaculum melis]
MDKKTLYDTVSQLELETEVMLKRLSSFRSTIGELVEQNAALQIENEHLRSRLAEIEKDGSIEQAESGMTKSRMNLEKLYEDGFHVCNMFYGSRRVDDEPCAFCLDVIYGERER